MSDDAALEAKTLKNFLVGERIKVIPAKASRRRIIARWLARRFEPDRGYTEAEVNAILRQHHDDFATWRRELVDDGFLTRHAGTYRRGPLTPDRSQP